MPTSTAEFLEIKETAAALLEELGLKTYLFEVEPREEQWELRVECALDGGWQSVVLPIEKERLLQSRRERATRERLLSEWGVRLAACKR
jgi:hypothetical protein